MSNSNCLSNDFAVQTINKSLIRKVKRHDRIARWVITLAGITIIASVVAILLLIVSVTLPLFRGAKAEILAETTLPDGLSEKDVLSLGVDFVELGQRRRQRFAYRLCFDQGWKIYFFRSFWQQSGLQSIRTRASDCLRPDQSRKQSVLSNDLPVPCTRCSGPTVRFRWSRSN